eukprot:gene6450-7114_t
MQQRPSSDHPPTEYSWLKTSGPPTHLEDIENRTEEKEASDEPSWLRDSPSPPRAVPPPRSTRKSVLKYPKSSSTTVRNSDSLHEEDCCCCPRDPVLYWFSLYHIFSGLSGVLAICASITVVISKHSSWRDMVLYSYGTVFSCIIVALELDFQAVVQRLRLLELWLFRGLFYSFVGFLLFAGSDPLDHVLFVNIVGLLLFLLGLGYSIMGMLCVKSIVAARYESRQSTSPYIELTDDFQPSPMKT